MVIIGVLTTRDTHIKRQVTSLLGDGDKWTEIVYVEENNILFCSGSLWFCAKPRKDKNLLYQHDEPNEPTRNQLRKDPCQLYFLSPL